jgi:zinc transporter ZupT
LVAAMALQGRRHLMAQVVEHARPLSSVRVAQGIAYFATPCSLVGAIVVIYVFKPSPTPWLYGILKSFLAAAISIALIADTLDTEGNVFSSWAFALGAGVTLMFVAPLTSNAPTGPNRVHPNDAHLTEREFHELRRVEFDSPTVRERALIGGVLAAAVIGLRNVAYGVWFFSLANSGRWMLQFPGILIFLAPQFVTLGAAVAVPVYFGTKCRWRTLLAVALSSAAYPLGYSIGSCALPTAVAVIRFLEFVGGMMSVLTFLWMFTSSLENTPWRHCVVSAFVGFGCMAGIRFGIFTAQ